MLCLPQKGRQCAAAEGPTTGGPLTPRLGFRAAREFQALRPSTNHCLRGGTAGSHSTHHVVQGQRVRKLAVQGGRCRAKEVDFV